MQSIYKFSLLFLSLILFNTAIAANQLSPVGYWQTTDEETQQPGSIVHISENKGVLEGKVVKLFNNPDAVCTQCSGEQHNQPIQGMTILWDFAQLPDGGWSPGKILAVRRGAIFDADMTLLDNGQTLALKVKAGFGGRTQAWQRVSGVKG